MRTKLLSLVVAGLLLASFTTKTNSSLISSKSNHLKSNAKKRSGFSIGCFIDTSSGQEYDVWGDGGGHVTDVYLTDGDENDVQRAAWHNGTYSGHVVNVSFYMSSPSNTISYSGYVYY